MSRKPFFVIFYDLREVKKDFQERKTNLETKPLDSCSGVERNRAHSCSKNRSENGQDGSSSMSSCGSCVTNEKRVANCILSDFILR